MKTRRIAVGLLAVAMAASGYGQQPSVDQRLEQLEQEILILKRQRELDQESAQQKATEAAKTTPIVKAGQDGFALQSADGNFILRLKGYAQADARFYLDDTAGKAPANGTDTFLLRRARPILEGTLYKDFDFRLMTDFGNGAATANLIQDAWVEWKHWPELKLRIGKYKPEVGLEQLQQDQWLFFAERGLPSDLVPNRDVGAQLSGDLFGGIIHYAGGVYNGVVDGGIADLDTFDSKDGAARIFVQPFKTTGIDPLKGLGLGAGGTVGNQQFTGSSTNLPTYKTTGQNTVFSYISGTAPNGLETRFTPQGYYYWGPVGLLGEYVVDDQQFQRAAVVDHIRNTAWQIQGSVVLTGEKATYTGVTPAHPFDLSKGNWGAFELVGRYGDLRIDPSAFSSATTALRFVDPTKSAQEARQWGVGVNWYLNKNVKLVLNYEQTEFDGGAGTTVAPTYNVQNRQIERILLTRAQFTF